MCCSCTSCPSCVTASNTVIRERMSCAVNWSARVSISYYSPLFCCGSTELASAARVNWDDNVSLSSNLLVFPGLLLESTSSSAGFRRKTPWRTSCLQVPPLPNWMPPEYLSFLVPYPALFKTFRLVQDLLITHVRFPILGDLFMTRYDSSRIAKVSRRLFETHLRVG